MSYIKMDSNLKSELKTPQFKMDPKINIAYLKYSEDLIGFNCKNLDDSLTSNLKNHFYGGVGKVSKKIELESIYFEPMGKLQSIAVFQRSINHIFDFSVSAGVKQELNRVDEDIKYRARLLEEDESWKVTAGVSYIF